MCARKRWSMTCSDGIADTQSAWDKLEELALADFESGADGAAVGLEVNFVQLENTVEYARYAPLQSIHMYDTAHVISNRSGIRAALRMTGYRADVAARKPRYIDTTLGDVGSLDTTVYGYDIADGTISGTKVLPGSIGGTALQNGSMDYVKLSAAAVGLLTADALHAVEGNIDRLVAGKLTADAIVAGSITADKIASKAITTDKLDAGAVTADKVAAGAITALKLATGAVTAEKIEAGSITADRMKAGTITAESGIIANAAITAAMIASINADVITAGTLSAERLILVGEDGLIYRINAGSGGLTAQQLQKEEYKKYLDGSVIVAQSITAAQIAAETIKAINLDVSEIFANEATIAALNAWDIRGSKYLNLYVPPKSESVAAGTSLLISEKQFRVTTPEAVFVILSENSPDGDELLSIDENGVSGRIASFDELHSPTVIPAVEAATYTAANGGELEAIVSGLNNTYLKGDISIDASAVTSASITLRGLMGGGRLIISGGVVNSVSLADCTARVQLAGVSLSAAAAAVNADHARLTLSRCAFNAGTGVVLTDGAEAIMDGCTGVCVTLANVERGAKLHIIGDNLPYGLVNSVDGEIYSAYPFEAAPSEEPDVEIITDIQLAAVNSRTWDNGWLSASEYGSAIYQGAVGGALRRGCMWFDASAIRGREILSATLSVRRMTGIGGGGAVEVGVYGTTATAASGTPMLGAKYASASIAREETKVIDVTQAVQHLADGDIAGLILYDTNTKTFNGKSYTYNYARFYGAGTAYAPVLTVRMKGVTA